MTLRKNRQLSGNPNDELQGSMGENELNNDPDAKQARPFRWTVLDEAIHRGVNYADVNMPVLVELRRDEGVTLHAMLKNAYQEGFLHGFEHKFDNTNYEEK